MDDIVHGRNAWDNIPVWRLTRNSTFWHLLSACV